MRKINICFYKYKAFFSQHKIKIIRVKNMFTYLDDSGDGSINLYTYLDRNIDKNTFNVAVVSPNNFYDRTITILHHIPAIKSHEYNLEQKRRKEREQKKILLVDDEHDHCFLYQMILREAGYECNSYTDALKAIQEFRADYYDLVLLDIKMPVLNGFELGKKIKEQDKTVRIVFITASEIFYEEFRSEHFPELRDIYYIQKPIENEELVERISELMIK
jgi:CheY-like chemotaxis protein